jgi:hypothetical protein
MTDGITIRRVSVEFLRPGPAHNQLLSPITQYLAVCNDAGAAVVTVPYEQREFERRLKELRYETGDQDDRLDMLHEIGRDIGRILESVPGFTGALTNDTGSPGTLVHLRLTLSASELALLPFELAEVPVGSTSSAVSIQPRPLVSVTRHIRTVSSEGLTWPDRPRILFVSADPEEVPFAEHRAALLKAIEPFQYPGDDDKKALESPRRDQYGKLLTILVTPTLSELQQTCAADCYTHIHVLTHGDIDLMSVGSYGIVLRGDNGSPDVVAGDRFVSAITKLGHRPSAVTIASCDSGNVGSLVIPGASFAHAVHQAGIPLVVGSQFPLSKEGSVPLTARLYEGLLWGEHPLQVLQRARAELHARFNTNWHDWASVVVYEALPSDLDEQLDVLQYTQAKSAINAALEKIDQMVLPNSKAAHGSLEGLRAAVDRAVSRLPMGGQFAVECVGLRASSRKRIAQAAFTLASYAVAQAQGLDDPYELLDQARLDYARAVRGLIVNDARAVQRKATLHWVLVQLVSLGAVLEQPREAHQWEAAFLASKHYLDHEEREQRAWAHASLAELYLLRLGERDLTDELRTEFTNGAVEQTRLLDGCYPRLDEFPIKSTRRQFERYSQWWGNERFDGTLKDRNLDRAGSWRADGGLVAVAKELAKILARHPSSQAGLVDHPCRPAQGTLGDHSDRRPTALPIEAPIRARRGSGRRRRRRPVRPAPLALTRRSSRLRRSPRGMATAYGSSTAIATRRIAS